MNPLRTIHVGVGGRGTWPIEVMGVDTRFQPVAVVDTNTLFLEKARGILSLPKSAAFASLHDAFDAVGADAVVICTPTRTHAPLVIEALVGGFHVLVEKGMAPDYATASKMVAAADAADRKLCVAQNYRYIPAERALAAAIADRSSPYHPGTVGIAEYVHHRYRPEPRTLDYPYAMVWDMTCHHVDSLSAWLGRPKRVTAHTFSPSWGKYPFDANVFAVIEYASGCICNYTLTHNASHHDWHATIQGSRGTLRIADGNKLEFIPSPTVQLGGSDAVSVPVPDTGRSEAGVVGDFYRYITEDVEPGISGRANLETLAVCEMIVRSATRARSVTRDEL